MVQTEKRQCGVNFESIVAPLTIPDFIKAIKECRSVYIPGNVNKFKKLFSRKDYWDCAAKGKREGAMLPTVSMTAYQLPLAFDPGAIRGALRSGNTVCTSHIDRASRSLRMLCVDAETLLGFPGFASVHCYYSPPGTGYSFFHIDNGIAITLQLEGKKSWKYCEKAAVPWSARSGGYRETGRLEWFGDIDWQPRGLQSPDEMGYSEKTLSPGDVLVIPPGVWHSVAADNSTSISLNLKLTAPPSIDGIMQILREICLHDTKWRTPFPFAKGTEINSGKITPGTKREIRDLLLSLTSAIQELANDGESLSQLWFGKLLGSQDNVVSSPEIAIKDSDTLYIPEGLRPRISISSQQSLALLGQNKTMEFSGKSIPNLIRDVISKRSFKLFKVASWPSARGCDRDSIKEIMQKLVDEGFLSVLRK
jgi:Cupin superfamily protein